MPNIVRKSFKKEIRSKIYRIYNFWEKSSKNRIQLFSWKLPNIFSIYLAIWKSFFTILTDGKVSLFLNVAIKCIYSKLTPRKLLFNCSELLLKITYKYNAVEVSYWRITKFHLASFTHSSRLARNLYKIYIVAVCLKKIQNSQFWQVKKG